MLVTHHHDSIPSQVIPIATALTVQQAETAHTLPSINQQAFGAMPTNLIHTTTKIVSGSNVKMLREISALIKTDCHMPCNLKL
uniref:Uncharacterized protein n=1 Tax=Romanomermis culicivorax TaxID=13658 RepID=A0A915J7L4_ROMCU